MVDAEVLLLAASCWAAELLVLAASCWAVASVAPPGTLEDVVEETGAVAVEETGVVAVASMVGGPALALAVPPVAPACKLVVGALAASSAASWAAASSADVESVLVGVVRTVGLLVVDLGLGFGQLERMDCFGLEAWLEVVGGLLSGPLVVVLVDMSGVVPPTSLPNYRLHLAVPELVARPLPLPLSRSRPICRVLLF
jgi:hypothetical protein